MIRAASYAKKNAPARGKPRSVRAGAPFFLAILAAFALTGCATCPAQPTRTEIQRVPVPVWQPIPERYIQPLAVPALPQPLTNEAIEIDTSLLEDLIERYENDRAQLRAIQRRRAAP